jgi:predicted acylesterase/phospholipase RssA
MIGLFSKTYNSGAKCHVGKMIVGTECSNVLNGIAHHGRNQVSIAALRKKSCAFSVDAQVQPQARLPLSFTANEPMHDPLSEAVEQGLLAPSLPDQCDTALVLGGGNALGAYHAGAYEVLHTRGIHANWVVGASMGAVTAAIIVGNAPEDRVPKLRQFWQEATLHTRPSVTGLLKPRQVYNGMHALMTLLWGRPSIFQHR